MSIPVDTQANAAIEIAAGARRGYWSGVGRRLMRDPVAVVCGVLLALLLGSALLAPWLGLQLGYLLGGSILIETVFNWPGTGFLLSNAIFTRDLPLLQGAILVLALFFVTINLVVDLAQSLIDPRIRRG